jgi:hypothetical protein
MPDRFETTDPRGYQVTCSQEAWNHILGNRPWMADWEAVVQAAIENPTMGIYQDADFADRQVYYMFRVTGKNRYLKVVVKIDSENSGTVVTAFPTFNAKAGEKLIWLKSTA